MPQRLGKMQRQVLAQFVAASDRQRREATPDSAAWFAAGWVRITGRWKILDSLIARGLLDHAVVKLGQPDDWPRGTHGRRIRPTDLGRLTANT